jgi:protein TonB
MKILYTLLVVSFAFTALAQNESPRKNKNLPAFSIASVEQRPIWPGCQSITSETERFSCFNIEIMKFIRQNFNMPPVKNRKEENKRTGKILVDFIIEKDGTINNVTLKRGVHPDVNREAIRLVKSFPTMAAPALVNGNPVRLSYTLPINIRFR